MAEPIEYHRKYRPSTFEEVLGQDATIKSLQGAVRKRNVHCFILAGPSGTGKTTLARIISREIGCDERNLREIDAATNSGAEAMRDEQQLLQYLPFGSAKSRAIIVDECHSLSKQAWQTLLKATEEPSEHVFWFFCTTELAKVPPTMRTRGVCYQLKEVAPELLTRLVKRVCKRESIALAEGVLDLIVKASRGSPRQALVHLAAVEECESRREASQVLEQVESSDPVIALCRLLARGGTWTQAMALYDDLKEQNPESVRIVAANYFGSMARGANSNKDAMKALRLLDAFTGEYNPAERHAPLMLSIGRCILE